jgi:hypothetical protein
MRSLSVVGDYHILGRCNDLDGVQVHAARRIDDKSGERLFSLHCFPFITTAAEHELRSLAERTHPLEDPIIVAPREIVRTPDGLFVVTDFVAGETLEHVVKNNHAAISKLLAVALVRDLARAIDRARERTGRSVLGDVTSSQILVGYESGELKIVSVGAPLIRGRAIVPSTKCLAYILWELLVGRKPQGEQPPKAGAELDRLVMNAINFPSDETALLADDLQGWLSSRTTGIDRGAEMAKLIRQHFSHKATAMRALVQRWRSQTAPPRATSIPPRAASLPPTTRAGSLPPVPRRSSGITRPIQERSLEAALAEPMPLEIVILDPEEMVPTDDLSSGALRQPERRGWPRLRSAALLLVLALACAGAALMITQGEADPISFWKSLLSGFR